MADSSYAPLLWLTDRSRYTTGLGHCRRERYFTNHFGPTGYGIVRKAESLPLMTGSYTHAALEVLYRYLQEHDQFPPVDTIRAAIKSATDAYEARVAARGFRGLLQSERADEIVREQCYLVTGMVWALCRSILPWIHTNYRIVQAETESLYVLDCTCGLGSGELDARKHDEQGCQGVGQMLKQDAIGIHRERGTLAYFEAKTTGSYLESWAPQWETKPQLAIGNFGLLERYGQEISENFIVGLFKGQRKTTKASDPFETEITRQESPFCYGYCKVGNPPLATDDWKPAYEWKDDQTGQTLFARKPYEKRGVWEIEQSDWPAWVASKQADPTLTPAECWIYSLPKSVLDKQVFLVGPLRHQTVQAAALKRQIVGEERYWQAALWELYELAASGEGWGSEAFDAALDRLVPASWECLKYGKRHPCSYTKLCFKEAGWEDPLGSGVFVPRRPHHEPELLQAIGRGLLPEVAEDAESEDE